MKYLKALGGALIVLFILGLFARYSKNTNNNEADTTIVAHDDWQLGTEHDEFTDKDTLTVSNVREVNDHRNGRLYTTLRCHNKDVEFHFEYHNDTNQCQTQSFEQARWLIQSYYTNISIRADGKEEDTISDVAKYCNEANLAVPSPVLAGADTTAQPPTSSLALFRKRDLRIQLNLSGGIKVVVKANLVDDSALKGFAYQCPVVRDALSKPNTVPSADNTGAPSSENMFTPAPEATQQPAQNNETESPTASEEISESLCDKYAANPLDPDKKAPGAPLGKIDVTKALPACLSAIRAHPEISRLQYQLGRVQQQMGNPSVARAALEAAANNGYTPAMTNLGQLYQLGLGVAKDNQIALQWYQKAAKQDYAPAQYLLGMMYVSGEGVPRDYNQAENWIHKAADSEFAVAEGVLGAMYLNGEGVPKDHKQARRWLQKGAYQGDGIAEGYLGDMYANGDGVPRDYVEANGLLRKAADQGVAFAQYQLGISYEAGNGVPKDLTQAMSWYQRAADQGFDLAKKRLAQLNKNSEPTTGTH